MRSFANLPILSLCRQAVESFAGLHSKPAAMQSVSGHNMLYCRRTSSLQLAGGRVVRSGLEPRFSGSVQGALLRRNMHVGARGRNCIVHAATLEKSVSKAVKKTQEVAEAAVQVVKGSSRGDAVLMQGTNPQFC